MKARYLLGKNDKRLEAYYHAAHGLEQLMGKNDLHIIGVMGSNIYQEEKNALLHHVANALAYRKKSILMMDFPLSNYANNEVLESKEVAFDCAEVNSAEVDVINAYLTQAKEQYEVIFFSLPPTYLSALSVEYAKLCDGVIMVERYGYTKQEHYVRNLETLKQYEIPVYGAISYR